MVKLSLEQSNALAQLVAKAQSSFEGVTTGTARLINDLYTGRDPSSGAQLPLEGAPFSADPEKVSSSWSYPQIGANLFQSRARQLVTELVPAVPSFHCEPIVAEASHLVEQQNKLMLWATRNGNLKQAARDAALYGLLGSHLGMKVVVDKNHPHLEKRLKWVAVPSTHCGYEPQLERFKYHTYQCQWKDIPKDMYPESYDKALKPWDIVTKTEVYHQGFEYTGKGCPMSVFLNMGEGKKDSQHYSVTHGAELDPAPLGEYVGTVDLPDCPLYIDSFLDPAPGEYIAPPECASWIPVIRSIHADIQQIEKEVGRINNIILYDKEAFSPDHIAAVAQNPSGNELYLAVDTSEAVNSFERDNGVSHKMRPVERSSALGELMQALQTHMMLLDEVVGASRMNMGLPQGPRKSAAEASILAQAGSRRSRDRLSVMADLFSASATAAFAFQRSAYGKVVKFPTKSELIEVIKVPDAKVARMAFRVEAVELGNLSKQGQLETHSASLTLLANLRQQAPDLITPEILVSEARKALMAYGNVEAAERLKLPPDRGGPLERIRNYIYGITIEISAYQEDDHETFISAYQREIAIAATNAIANVPIMEIQAALERHQQFAAQRPAMGQAIPQSPVSGFNANGQPDNDILAALQGGQAPFADPTTLTQF